MSSSMVAPPAPLQNRQGLQSIAGLTVTKENFDLGDESGKPQRADHHRDRPEVHDRLQPGAQIILGQRRSDPQEMLIPKRHIVTDKGSDRGWIIQFPGELEEGSESISADTAASHRSKPEIQEKPTGEHRWVA